MDSWRAVPGFPSYQISPEGLIRRSEPCNRAPCGYIMKPKKDRDGYLRVSLMCNGKKKLLGVHRLVALAFIGPQPSLKHEVAHNDGTRTNNHYSNLRWATTLENQRDRFIHGTHNRGERHGKRKLSNEQVMSICADSAESSVLARRFGVTRQMINHIRKGRAWLHLTQVQPNGQSQS